MQEETKYEPSPLKVKDGMIEPFAAKRSTGTLLIIGTGTLTLHYGIDGQHWSQDEETHTIPESGSISIVCGFVVDNIYKVTSTGAISSAMIKYE